MFVFAVTQVTTLLSHDLSWAGLGRSMLVLALVWWAWSAFVWAANAQEGTISIIDVASKKVTRTLNANVRGANRLKFTPDGKSVFVSSLFNGDLTIFNAGSRQEVKRIKLGRGEKPDSKHSAVWDRFEAVGMIRSEYLLRWTGAYWSDPATRDIPVIVLTGRGDDETYSRARELGAAQLLTKPVARDLLMRAIDGQLGSSKPHPGKK